MSLYNMLFGVNGLSPFLKEILNLDKVDFPEYPDILSWKSEDGKKYISLELSDWKDDRNEEEFHKAREKYLEKCKELGVYPTGRFRDIYLNEDGTRIILYTRNGGGNREAYEYVFELLRSHPNYISDYDDDFDCTYAYIDFSVPKEYGDDLRKLATGEKPESVSKKFQKALKDLTNKEKE